MVEIIGRTTREKEQDATLHAEIKAIRQANQQSEGLKTGELLRYIGTLSDAVER